MLTDSHCHLASHRYPSEEIPELLEHAHTAGITRIISLATSLEDLAESLTHANHPAVHTCIGIHPCEVHHAPDDATKQLAEWVTDPRVCGIGETGLDYYHPAPDGWAGNDFRERQRDFLRQHFALAATAQLPIVIHTRDLEGFRSFEDALKIYQDFHTTVRAVFHCFIGPWENAKRVLDLGGLVSFGGVATFKTGHQVRETALKCPPGSFMVETDAPYLAPDPHRGKRNEPAFLSHTATRLAKLRGESLDALASHTTETATRFFRLRADSE